MSRGASDRVLAHKSKMKSPRNTKIDGRKVAYPTDNNAQKFQGL